MLDIALIFLKNELNTYLQTQIGSDSATVELINLVDETGKYTFTNSIAVSILNIEEDRIFKSQVPERIYANGQHVILEPDLKLNLHVLFATNFPKDAGSRSNYDQALKYISYILMYFQMHPAFSSLEYPALDPRIDKLTVELQSLNYEQLNQIWAFIGAKQLPSLIYKIRMVSVQGMVPKAVQLPIMEIKTNLHS